MALDSAGPQVHTLPDPTGTFDGGDRQHLLDCYSGIAFAAPAGATLMAQERMFFRRTPSRVWGRVN